MGASGRVQSSPSDPGAYGSWTSPASDVSYVAGSLYRVIYTIHTTQSDQSKVPNCRLYTEFLKSGNMLVATGIRVGKGIFAPDGDGEEYSVLADPIDLSSAGVDTLRFKFEVIDFSVEESGTNYMDRLEIQRLDESSIVAAGSAESSFSAPFGTGWSSLVLHDILPAFGDATVGSDSTGLYINTPGPYTTDAINYGSWSLGSGSSGVSFDSGKMYWAKYAVRKGGASDNVGKIRMFNLNESGDWNALLELEPAFESAHMPSTGGKEYTLWFTTMPDLYTGGDSGNNRMSFNFDVSDGSDTQSGSAYLTDIDLYSAPLSLLP